MESNKALRYLWVYSAADEWTIKWHERNRLNRISNGFDITYFCNTPPSLQRRWLPFSELDRLWKTSYPPLLTMYEELARLIEKHDVLILYNGANLHPDFISQFRNIFKVYTFGDPESAEILAQPIAPYFDIHLVNQISEISRFQSWGLNKTFFWPLGSLNFVEDICELTENRILEIQERPIPLALFCEYNNWRSSRLDELLKTYPNAVFGGNGWKNGFVSWTQMWETYRKTQIGWNIHNTSGFNFRTYDLLSLGVMQICDNKSDISEILVDGKEVISFTTMKECIELSDYYLSHPYDQREIALAGWKRWKKDYTPEIIWSKLVEIVENEITNHKYSNGNNQKILIELKTRRTMSQIQLFFNLTIRTTKQLIRKIIGLLYKKSKYG